MRSTSVMWGMARARSIAFSSIFPDGGFDAGTSMMEKAEKFATCEVTTRSSPNPSDMRNTIAPTPITTPPIVRSDRSRCTQRFFHEKRRSAAILITTSLSVRPASG